MIRPSRRLAEHYEGFVDYAPLLEEAVDAVRTLTLVPDGHVDIASRGLVVGEIGDL